MYAFNRNIQTPNLNPKNGTGHLTVFTLYLQVSSANNRCKQFRKISFFEEKKSAEEKQV